MKNSKFENLNISLVKNENFNHIEFKVLTNFNKYLIHGFTTRLGGASINEFKGLNLGLSTSDSYQNVVQNYNTFFAKLDINLEEIVFSRQVHEDKVRIVTSKDIGMGLFMNDSIPEFDAMITKETGIILVSFFADCTPVFFYDYRNNIVGIAHSGWKGTLKNIVAKTIDGMIENFNSKSHNIIVAIGPSLGKCCFEVDEDVYTLFKDVFRDSKYYTKTSKKYNIDLALIIKDTLLEKGIQKQNIASGNICTKCNGEYFFSHRGQNGKTGRQIGFIGLK
jgi:YfiH family protein